MRDDSRLAEPAWVRCGVDVREDRHGPCSCNVQEGHVGPHVCSHGYSSANEREVKAIEALVAAVDGTVPT